MRIAREGIALIAGFLGAGIALALVAGALSGTLAWVLGAAAVVLLALGVFSLWFFRDPDRVIPAGPGVVVSPADGTVVAVTDDPEGPSVAIFLSVFNVHVNRSPIAGRVTAVSYRKGRFLAAFDERAGEMNERSEILIEGEEGSVRVRQIAGLLARRIICNVKPGDTLGAGERFGLIRFGSRTDLRMPPGSSVGVRVGDKVRGGASVIGRMATATSDASADLAEPASALPGARA
jgi:phosphatidylserine decarboxylase